MSPFVGRTHWTYPCQVSSPFWIFQKHRHRCKRHLFSCSIKESKKSWQKYLFETMTNLLTFALQCVGVKKQRLKDGISGRYWFSPCFLQAIKIFDAAKVQCARLNGISYTWSALGCFQFRVFIFLLLLKPNCVPLQDNNRWQLCIWSRCVKIEPL